MTEQRIYGRELGGRELGRREVIGGALALGAASAIGGPERAAGKIDKLNFVVWTYGDIYTKISKKFTDDWGIPVNSTISVYNDQPAKLMTMFAGGDAIDVTRLGRDDRRAAAASRSADQNELLIGVVHGAGRSPA